jgi:hypothetical protein
MIQVLLFFATLDTGYKAHLRCRGVGRRLWLKVFERVVTTKSLPGGYPLRQT